jgi:hypothetical protein
VATSCLNWRVSGISYGTGFVGCSGSEEAGSAKVVWEINHIK